MLFFKGSKGKGIGITNADEQIKKWCELFDLELSENAQRKVNLIEESTRETTYIDSLHRYSTEKYVYTVSDKAIDIRFSSRRSLFYALCEIASLVNSDSLKNGTYSGYPLFKARGYIEGFYGKPWNFEERCSVLKLMAKNRMNTVYYAPKDDDYHRAKWRENYPQVELQNLKSLLELAKLYEMDFFYCIAPGLSIKYSDPKEFEALKSKTKQLYDIGVRNFGLLLDDIDENFSYDEDKKMFGEMVDAHIDITQRYYSFVKEMDTQNKLTVCPMLYNGTGTEYYISKYGKNIEPDISLFWTGRDVCSRDLTSLEAIRFIDGTNHKPLYWDNYPVNDGSMYNEMHIGPIINRDKDLYKYSEGIISNTMEYAECSKIPLITFADYLWDSENYNPEESWENAIEQVVGKEHKEAFITFADHLRTSCLKDNNSARMNKMFQTVEKYFNSKNVIKAVSEIKNYIGKMHECRDFLKTDEKICVELKKWGDKFTVACDIIDVAFKYMVTKKESLKNETFELINKYDSMQAKLTDINVSEELGNLLGSDINLS